MSSSTKVEVGDAVGPPEQPHMAAESTAAVTLQLGQGSRCHQLWGTKSRQEML